MDPVRVSVLGGGLEVGANAFLLEVDGARLLLDAGLHPRRTGVESLPRFDDVEDVDAILVTHGHLDHVGALPVACRHFPRAQVHWTRSTEAVSLRQLRATLSVMRKEIAEGVAGASMLFRGDELEELPWRSAVLEVERRRRISAGGRPRVSAFHVGHLLGAAGFLVEGREARVVYTGDFCLHARELQPGLDGAPPTADVLIVEGTYGATPEYDASGYEREVARFAADVSRVMGRGGSVLIPSFALGRTQEMLAMLRRLMARRHIPRAPIYISGLGRAMNEVHDRCRFDPGLFPRRWKLGDAARVMEHEDLGRLPQILQIPSLFVVTSGMMIENTLSARLAERMVGDPRHAVYFVGYCDPAELGHRVLRARPGDWVEFRRARPMTQVMTGDIGRYYFSAHADRRQILELVEAVDPTFVVLVHGEPAALEWLAGQIEPRRQVWRPAAGESRSFPSGAGRAAP